MVFVGAFISLPRASLIASINGGLNKQLHHRIKKTSLLPAINMEGGYIIESHKFINLYKYCDFGELLKYLPRFFGYIKENLAISLTPHAISNIEEFMRLKILSESVLVSRPLNIDLSIYKSIAGEPTGDQFHLVMESLDKYYELHMKADGSLVYRRCAGPGVTGNPIDIVIKMEENSLKLAKHMRSHVVIPSSKSKTILELRHDQVVLLDEEVSVSTASGET